MITSSHRHSRQHSDIFASFFDSDFIFFRKQVLLNKSPNAKKLRDKKIYKAMAEHMIRLNLMDVATYFWPATSSRSSTQVMPAVFFEMPCPDEATTTKLIEFLYQCDILMQNSRLFQDKPVQSNQVFRH